jgi:transcriptional regulator GlxA family with amidase domain
VHVCVVAVPQTVTATVIGVAEYLMVIGSVTGWQRGFRVEVVSPETGPVRGPLGVSLVAQRRLADVARCDIVVVPTMIWHGEGYRPGTQPEVAAWLRQMYDRGALLCGACTGTLLIAETGLLDGHEATLHWAYTDEMKRHFPAIRLRAEQVFVVSGTDRRLVSTGGSGSWHDLVLYLVALHAGPAAARAAARWFMVDWHRDGQAPYAGFLPRRDHDDAMVRDAQLWLDDHVTAPHPVEQLVQRSGVPERSFKRRFRRATGCAPLEYVQALRLEQAKRLLETGELPVDEISVAVGYENPAFFRRLFKRSTGLTPAVYRRRFQLPAFALQALERAHETTTTSANR